MERRAVIDVGTNSVKLLVAEIGHEVHPVIEVSEQTRLGKGFYQTGRLTKEAINLTAEAVRSFAETARKEGVKTLRLIATSAARDASNRDELISALEGASGVALEVITGDEEAQLVFDGVSTDPALANHPLCLLDVGGGSTEFIVGQGRDISLRQSFQLGTVRLLERWELSDPPNESQRDEVFAWLNDFIGKTVSPALRPALARFHEKPLFVGSGGTTSIMARIHKRLESFDRAEIDGAELTADQVRALCGELWRLPLGGRRNLAGLPPNRADVILMGVAIYAAVIEAFAFPAVRVTARGLRFAALLKPKEISGALTIQGGEQAKGVS